MFVENIAKAITEVKVKLMERGMDEKDAERMAKAGMAIEATRLAGNVDRLETYLAIL